MPGTRSADRTARIETFAALEALPADALALLDTQATLFGSRRWWQVVQDHAMPEGSSPCFAVCRIDGRAVALFPLRIPAEPGSLDSLTTPYTCHYVPLLAPGLDGDTTQAAFAAFARFCRRWAVTRLDALDGDWHGMAPLARGARRAGLRLLRFDHFGNWHEDVAGLGWAGYLARRPGALRETVRRRLRRAEQVPDARFDVLRTPDEMAGGIAAYESVYARSWKEPEPFPRFNAALMRATAAAGTLRLGLWRIGDTPVAVQFWIVEHGQVTVLKLAHDEAFKAHSPGTVLTALMLRRLLDQEQVTAIDFGRGDDDYKQGWATERRQRVGLLLVNPWRVRGLAQLGRHTRGRLRASWQTCTVSASTGSLSRS
ncbi:MAG TPA: GNAT family N-acetyltransferase [Acetobacteraceae bacterium]